MESLLVTVMQRDGLTRAEAHQQIEEARAAIREGADPEEILYEDFGLEPDFLFELL